ncbi:MAG: phosphate signaling complex protein PhoU [Evtepia sp.]|uniref:phosphate signaling complex protein PhoU n=1 Tax=Evtepia sp. TaxID=2773933 RepID=UPI002A80D05A|nr:phosphate signaling complex protein PhoU [Evtepia sp.]MDY4431223.1 phosphate signaling complex protein PhoU [Evtepia sp.]
MRDLYNRQMKKMYALMTEMGALCQDAIGLSVKTLDGAEPDARELEEHVFAIDSEIDAMEREIESLCTKLLLRQQPVASDLRRVTAALKMVTDLERIGDQASDIAELSGFIRASGLENRTHLEQMAEEAIRMVRESVEAFVRLDLNLARAVIAYDDVVDGWFHRIKQELIAIIASDSSRGEECLDILMVAKYLERIGDHATNLAEWVEYAITGSRSKNGAPYVPADRSER